MILDDRNFWHDQFEMDALLLVAKIRPLGPMLGGDAPVALAEGDRSKPTGVAPPPTP